MVIDQMFDACMKVRDVYRYKIEKDIDLIAQRVGRDKAVWEECHLPTIVLLLESPHTDEYDNGKPIAPAMGTTGRNLDSHLGGVLSQIRNRIFNGSRVIVSNPVQFQASLHMILRGKMNGKVRDAVWRSLWQHQDQYIQNCFASRMENYSPYIVINACTKGYQGKGELQKKVTALLTEKRNYREIYEISHPSRWTIPKLRKV